MSIEVNESHERLSGFLSSHNVGVLATSTKEGKPYATTVYFTYDQQVQYIFYYQKRYAEES